MHRNVFVMTMGQLYRLRFDEGVSDDLTLSRSQRLPSFFVYGRYAAALDFSTTYFRIFSVLAR
jgi:hypothetical protein